MGFIAKYPYTNAHELNLDYVLEKMAQIDVDAVASVTETVNTHTEQIAELQNKTSDIDAIRSKANEADATADMALEKANEIDDVKSDLTALENDVDTIRDTKLDINGSASLVHYDNTTSQLGATNVQAAIDALVEAGGGGGGTASSVLYNNVESGLTSSNVQGAIDELAGITMTATLEVGETELHFNNEAITTNSTFDFYTTHYGVNPTVAHTVNGTLTLVFDEQDEPIGVKVVIK